MRLGYTMPVHPMHRPLAETRGVVLVAENFVVAAKAVDGVELGLRNYPGSIGYSRLKPVISISRRNFSVTFLM